MKPAIIIELCILFLFTPVRKRVVILWAAPLSATSLPSMAPNPRTGTITPIVLPMPFSIVDIAFATGMPTASATEIATIITAMKGFSLKTIMSIRKRVIPQTAINSGMWGEFWLLVACCLLLVKIKSMPK